VLVWRKFPGEKNKSLTGFLEWVLGEGQGYAEKLKYAPLPKALAERAKKEVAQVKLTP
jgi:ABC-type phosphate transport system substrate-binding protein